MKGAHWQLSVSIHSTSHHEPVQHKFIYEIKVSHTYPSEVRWLFPMSIQPDEKAPKINMKNGEFYDEDLLSRLIT